MTKKQELKKRLEYCIELILQASNGKWVSVKDHSLSSIYYTADIPKNYWSIITDILTKNQVFMSEGERSGMRYKFDITRIVDYSVLAQQVLEAYQVWSKSKRANNAMTRTTKSIYDQDEKKQNSKTTITNTTRKPLDLGDLVYCMIQGEIVEARVIGKKFNEDGKGFLYKFEYYTRLLREGDTIGISPMQTIWCKPDIMALTLEDLFRQVERSIIKFKNKQK